MLGRHVSAAALAGLLGKPARLELDELVDRGLLSRSHDDEYRFKNDMTMTVAYGLIPSTSACRCTAPPPRGSQAPPAIASARTTR